MLTGSTNADQLAALRAGEPVLSVKESGVLADMAKEVVATHRGRAMFGYGGLARLNAVRADVEEKLGQAGLHDVCATIGMFNGITKVADMTGCLLDADVFKPEVRDVAISTLNLQELRGGIGVRLMAGSAKL